MKDYNKLQLKKLDALGLGATSITASVRKLILSNNDKNTMSLKLKEEIKNYFYRVAKIVITYKYKGATQTNRNFLLSKKDVDDILSTMSKGNTILKLLEIAIKDKENTTKNLDKLDKTLKKWMKDNGISTQALFAS